MQIFTVGSPKDSSFRIRKAMFYVMIEELNLRLKFLSIYDTSHKINT